MGHGLKWGGYKEQNSLLLRKRHNLKFKINRLLMKGLIQRVRSASVRVDGRVVGEIDQGILLLLGVDKHDSAASTLKLLDKVLHYRIFDDEQGRMDKSLLEVNGGLLVVSQFTLVADTHKGRKPSFSSAADPVLGRRLYDLFLHEAQQRTDRLASGVFAADMQVSLVNDGPVTFLLEV